ncbi:MAG: hypothetical protein R3B96_08150 [Pirellulaceae bacterium]
MKLCSSLIRSSGLISRYPVAQIPGNQSAFPSSLSYQRLCASRYLPINQARLGVWR